MKRAVLAAAAFLLIAGCSQSPTSNDGDETPPTTQETSNARFSRDGAEVTAYEYLRDMDIRLFKVIATQKERELYEIGSTLTPEELASLPPDKRALLEAAREDAPESKNHDEVVIYDLDTGERMPLLWSLQQTSAEELAELPQEEREVYQEALTPEELASLSPDKQAALR